MQGLFRLRNLPRLVPRMAPAPDVATLVRQHSVANTIIVTFTNDRQMHFTLNWARHWKRMAGLRAGLLVGTMNMRDTDALYRMFAARLQEWGVGTYTVNSAEVRIQPQGGRWFHVLPLLRTGVRLLLSDSDAVWLRNPLPYLRALEERHPLLDFAVSSDAQGGTDGLRLGLRQGRGLRRRGDVTEELGSELDVEAMGACWASMNIGILFFPPGARRGALRLMEEATSHLAEKGNLRRVDQGPLNFRWKHGAKGFRWQRQLHGVRDASGRRLCGLVNGSVVGGVLPSAQFCNTLTCGVLKLWKSLRVEPYVLHATWMRQQDEPFKVARLREAMAWEDSAGHYQPLPESVGTSGGNGYEGRLVRIEPSVRFVSVDVSSAVDPALDTVQRIRRGALPLHHLRLMHAQLAALRNAFFFARSLGSVTFPTSFARVFRTSAPPTYITRVGVSVSARPRAMDTYAACLATPRVLDSQAARSSSPRYCVAVSSASGPTTSMATAQQAITVCFDYRKAASEGPQPPRSASTSRSPDEHTVYVQT